MACLGFHPLNVMGSLLWTFCTPPELRFLVECWTQPFTLKSLGERSLFSAFAECLQATLGGMQVLFFHGLQLVEDYSKAHLSTWESSDGSCIWPQRWLVEEFPGAQIVSMSYSPWMGSKANENVDMYNMGENLISDLLQEGIGETPHCPVILVGHSIGGLIIKQLCSQAHDRLHKKQGIEKDRLAAFLQNIRGIFFYATPHHGSLATNALADIIGGPLLKYVETLSKDTERLNAEFEDTNQVYKWSLAGLGETLPTRLGPSLSVIITPEASARFDNFNVVEGADHISICKPKNKTARSFRKLKCFLADIAENTKGSHQCQGLPDYPVELETRAQDLLEKLRSGAVLGIFGMSGIGKTTLAKQVFNTISRDFRSTCFVDNVKGFKPHELSDWLLTHFHQNGMKLDKPEWSKFEKTKTLIVMDDIDSEDQLKFLPKLQDFGKCSCLIMTSRDKEVFKFYEDCVTYEVSFLKEEDSKRLFCQYAFSSTDIPILLRESVNKVVRKCDGLPLTLEVMGRYLRNHSTDAKVWEQTIDKLGKALSITGAQNDRVWAPLKVSYDSLAKEEQEMFIEAATLFNGKPLDRALAAWSSITENAETTWRNLVNRSLVREIVVDHWADWEFRHPFQFKTVWMHEQLRDLAEKIVGGGMASGYNEGANLLVDQLNGNTVEVQPISLRLSYYSSDENRKILHLDKLAKMKRLKYVELRDVFCEGRGKGLASNLSILKWDGKYYPGHLPLLQRIPCFTQPGEGSLPTFKISLAEMKNLAVLELERFVVPKTFPEALGNLPNLRILVLSELQGLDRLPKNFGNLSLLKRMEVVDLGSLKLPASFGNLKALEQLAFENIESLQFPESLGDLSSLVTFSIKHCAKLAGLPDFPWGLTSLEDLVITNCSLIKYLPHGFSQLSKLQRLSIRTCELLEGLGDAFGNLSSLRQLNLLDVGVQALPKSFGHLCALEELTLEAYKLKTLSDNFCNLTRLVKLKIDSDELDTLPENFYLLESLRELRIDCPKLERLPGRLGELPLLEVLELSVESVKALPESVGKLSSLRVLKFSSRNVELLPKSLGQVSSLKTLKLDCDSLDKLPDSLHKLSLAEELTISSKKLECLPESLGRLQSLRRLNLQHLPVLRRLPEKLGELRSLERLAIRACASLESLPDSLGCISCLREVSLEECMKLGSLPDSLGQSSLPELESPQGDNSNKLKRQEEESNRAKGTRGMRLWIYRCTLLDDSVLESLGWTLMFGRWKGSSGRYCQRKETP